MGKVEKVIVLSVLTLIALILVVSWTVDDPIQAAKNADPKPAAAPADMLAQTPSSANPAPFGAPANGAANGAVSPTSVVPGGVAQPPLSTQKPAPSALLSSSVQGLPAGAALLSLDGLEDSYLPDMKFYTWREGDSFRLVAHRYYGDFRKLTLLRKVNEGRTEVKPGQKIFVPVFDIEGDAGALAATPNVAADMVATNDAKPSAAKATTAKTATPKKADAKEEPAKSASGKRIHVVKEGESLWKIAKAELGNGGRWKEIYEANKDVLSSPEAVKKGQKLRIP